MTASTKVLIGCISQTLKEISAYLGVVYYKIDSTKSLSKAGMQEDDLQGLAQGLTLTVGGYYGTGAPKIFPVQLQDGDIVIDDLLRLTIIKSGLATKQDSVLADDSLHQLVAKAQSVS